MIRSGPTPRPVAASSRARIRHRRRGSPFFTAFTILTLLFGAFSPVLDGTAFAQTVTPEDGGGSDAQATETPADQSAVPVQPTQEPPTVDTSMQTPTPTPTPTPTETVMNELLGAVNIAYWECPAGTDPASVPAATLETTCTDRRDGVTFALTDGNGATQTQDTGYYDDSQIGFTEIPIGAITFGQATPPVSAVVLCDGIVQHGGPETGTMQLPVANGMVSWTLKDDEIVFCNWYAGIPAATTVTPTATTPTTGATATTTPTTSGGTGMTPSPTASEMASGTPVNQLVGSINITYRECPASFDLTNPPGDPATACTTQRNGVQFDLAASTAQTFSQLTGYYDDSVVSFTEIPTGSTTVTQNPAAGQTLVICDGIVQHGGPETGDMTMPVTNGSITWDLKDDEIVGCDWYTNGVSGAEAAAASLAVTLYTCPSTFDLSTANVQTAQTTCTTPGFGNRFDLSDGTNPAKTLVTGLGGSVNFGAIAPGAYSLQRYPVPSAAVVFCHSTLAQGTGHDTGGGTSAGAYGIALSAGENMTCTWYETEAATGSGTVIINKHACPASYVPSSPPNIYDLAASCNDDAGPTSFVVTWGQTSVPGTTSGTPNLLEMQNVPAGLVIVTENTLPGYGAPIVTCKGDSPTNDPAIEVPATLLTVTANTITWNLVDQQTMFCDWFNMPSGYGSVLINKHSCPQDYVAPNPVDPYDLALKCQTDPGPVNFTLANGAYSFTGTTSGTPDLLSVSNVPSGMLGITETIPAGYAAPIVYCKGSSVINDPALEVPFTLQQVSNGTVSWHLLPDQMLYCDWFNIAQPPAFSVIIYKYDCGNDPSYFMTNGVPDYQKFTTLCTHAMPGVPFTAIQNGTPVATATSSNSNPFSLSNLPVTITTIQETIPSGYGQPYVYCGDAYAPTLQLVTNGAITLNPSGSGNIVCSWYNIQDGPGSITVYKWFCPEGYDWTLPGADPKTDCATPQNGVTFVLHDNDPNTVDPQSNTGDSVPYAVTFGGLPIGDYTLTETVPSGIGGIFVLDCTGLYTDSIHPVPLWTGNDFPFHVGSHDQIVCNWYNVPYAEHGGIVIHKELCTTVTWVSSVECDTWEYGASFIVTSGGSTVGQGTTDAWGTFAIGGLPAGSYTVTETGGSPCHVESRVGDGQAAVVTNGAVTVEGGKTTDVWVYNCSSPTTPGVTQTPVSGKPPVKYPNTGRQDTQVIEPETATATPPTTLGTPQACTGLKDGTPVAATPEAGVRCGAVPVSIASTAINLDAKVEILETVNGQMQDPTTPDQAAWYKETAKLGGAGNTVLAGHLNYWGVPEGVFFAIDQLRAGDTIAITGNDGTVYTYVVDWVKQVDATVAPGADIVGETAQPSLTLMTCGGPWNAEVSEYTERTVVRAHLASTGPAPEATPEG